jgi:hypothetical protein
MKITLRHSPDIGNVLAIFEDGTIFAIEEGEFEKAHGDFFFYKCIPLTTFEKWLDAKESQWCEVEQGIIND